MKDEIVVERGNMCDGYEDIAEFQNIMEIEKHTVNAPKTIPDLSNSSFLEINAKPGQILNEIQIMDSNTVEYAITSNVSQDLISNYIETNIVKDKRISLEMTSTEDKIDDKVYKDIDILSTWTLGQGTVCQESVDKENKEEYSLDINLNTNRAKDCNVVRGKLNNVNIDYVPVSHQIEPYTKDIAKQSNHKDGDENNIRVVEFERLAIQFNIEQDFILSVMVERNPLCEEKIFQKMLRTSETLFVSLSQDDLYVLQKRYNDNQSSNKSQENGRVKWHRWRSNQKKRFWCSMCPFTADNKCDLMVHIVENHKELAVKKKLPPAKCMSPGEDPDIIWYKCLDCAYVTSLVHSYYAHSLRHNSYELQSLSCALCSYKTKLKVDLTKHISRHVAKYHKCIHCSFQSKDIRYLEIHVQMLHKAHEVKLLKCKKCSFKTKYKNSIKMHVLRHSDARKMYKCALCPFQTPRKSVLIYSHSIRHRSYEEVRIHQCEFCPYKAKVKCDLTRHMLTHKSFDEIKSYKCDICHYRTARKYLLNTHRITHQAPDEDNMHPCDLCPYQGKTAKHLSTHKNIHKRPEECRMYKCEECSYQSRNSANVKRHALLHKNVDDLPFFQCDKCEYRGITKERLLFHYHNVHRHPKDVKWYKCNECDYQTKQHGNLKRHKLRHIERNTFKCDKCPYHTNVERRLMGHMAKHSKSYLKCDQCGFQFKFSSTFYRHRKHIHPPKHKANTK